MLVLKKKAEIPCCTVVIYITEVACMKHDLSKYSRLNLRRRPTQKPSVNPSTVALRAYRKRYNIESYTVQLDTEVKKRWMAFCLAKGLSPSGLVQAFMQETLSEDEKKSA